MVDGLPEAVLVVTHPQAQSHPACQVVSRAGQGRGRGGLVGGRLTDGFFKRGGAVA